jgi:hypothetical protein
MSRRKPSLRDALAAVFERRDDPVQVERRRRALLGPQPQPVSPRVLVAVRQVLDREPDATPAAVCRCVPMRRRDVLAAVRELRAPGNRFPSPRTGAS